MCAEGLLDEEQSNEELVVLVVVVLVEACFVCMVCVYVNVSM